MLKDIPVSWESGHNGLARFGDKAGVRLFCGEKPQAPVDSGFGLHTLAWSLSIQSWVPTAYLNVHKG